MREASNLICAALETLGFDLEDENFDGTPERFVKYLLEYKRPYDPGEVLRVGFTSTHTEEGYKGMVVQANIPFRTICPHHLLPVLGRCHVGYIPNTRLVGISKFTRIVEAVGHELPRMQETCTDIIADTLMKQLQAKGVMVCVIADHGCMTGRGVKVHNTPTSTSTLRGLFRDVPAAKEEFFELVKMQTKG
jgi:GTP cyclohydrolase I